MASPAKTAFISFSIEYFLKEGIRDLEWGRGGGGRRKDAGACKAVAGREHGYERGVWGGGRVWVRGCDTMLSPVIACYRILSYVIACYHMTRGLAGKLLVLTSSKSSAVLLSFLF